MPRRCRAGPQPRGSEHGLHCTLDMQLREDNCRLHRSHAPAMMHILGRSALNMVRPFQQNYRANVSIKLLRDQIGCHHCPDHDFALALP